MLNRTARLLLVLVFAVHGLTAPFWVLCHAAGSDAPVRVELSFASCCNCCDGRATPGGTPSSALDADCDACHDERMDLPGALQPVRAASLVPACAVLQAPPVPAAPVAGTRALAFRPDRSDDPPLFLTLRNFRI